ncbi:glutamate synthase large subunit [Halanaerobacter jeridensis]|uniref:Glutamate synthase domain-containing protein 2/glutamate synthase domain-containing protein 1/glutamate synthase domain-containing protein 3/Holliday junction resolvase n=1 Tax=Halanaerobacter jeridensis TaxID=706427 RepID=A0A939BRI8_9FIRM|nr:glutamate synthase large subunit [Halanaerobacter jeridensis]MBM7557394.1 glutamate synthase domain-containing protein 2/glutamate synthase domain-containing protein 1/glutamate synthase domain-containing protein 3/Holliday junction resolvase [Halanaerobacter jeridensis]
MVKAIGIPEEEGLYSPEQEKDNCGVGFIAHKFGNKSHRVVEQGLEILIRLAHRGAVGADPETGDGAGISIQMPDQFLRKVMNDQNVELPAVGDYGVGMLFLPQDEAERQEMINLIEKLITEEGQEVLGWRDVPVAEDEIGENAASKAPYIKQVVIGKGEGVDNFELKLYFLRRKIEKLVARLDIEEEELFNVTSFSSKVLIYKGLLLAEQISKFYLDLKDESMQSGFALVHQRYSTNTFPSWDLAQPFKYLAHNGEINTLRGNINWMEAREPSLESDILGDKIKELFPITDEEASDSSNLNNVVELMVASGMDVVEAMTMLIPEAWSKNEFLDEDVKAYHEYNATLMEPWDGPAAIGFTDGEQIGAKLDRNGLRPARYTVTKDDYIIAASEVGTLDTPSENIAESGRLQPGEMLVVDTEAGEIIHDEEIKEELSSAHPYREWLENNKQYLEDVAAEKEVESDYSEEITKEIRAFGYSREDLEVLIAPMAANQKEAIGSMGNDTPLAVLSNRTKPLFNYFKQLFAQVTNPPIDSIREKVVMSLKTNLGSKANILERTADKAKTIEFDSPILDNQQLNKIANLDSDEFKAATVDTVFDPEEENGLQNGLIKLFNRVTEQVEAGANVIILSDRGVNDSQAPIPSLLATSAVHNYLIENKMRNGVDLVVETGEAREVMHFALLIGYGALAVNPYLALDTISYMSDEGLYLTETEDRSRIEKRKRKYLKAVDKGLLKIMSKMGISTIQSYRGAQIFEAVGLSSEFVEQYFPGTTTRIEGIGLEVLEKEMQCNHQRAYNDPEHEDDLVANEGEYKWRAQGEHHLFSPEAIAKLQHATRKGDYELYKKYAQEIDDQSEHLATIRGLFDFKDRDPIPIEEVEAVEEIRQRFVTGAMSFGSISKEAHETLAKAMNEIGGMSNSGEGGEDPERFYDDRRSAIKQVASGRFGVTTNYLANADELQIKMAQGAKPGEGGHLPGKKVSESIAKVRHTTPGIDLISPPPHHDIYSIEDLAQLIFDLKNVNPDSRVSVKLVSEVGIGTIAAGVSKAHADMILVSGFDGGTGAAPLTSIKHAGLPWELGVSEAHQVLVKNNLRDRVRVQTDGQMKTGRDVAIAALLGAEEYGFATAPLVVLGCIMMRQCSENSCPVGIATQDPRLRERFAGSKEQIINYFTFVAQHLREIMAELGFRTVDEMIGQTDKLDMNDAIKHWKSEGINVEKILHQQQDDTDLAVHCTQDQDHGIDDILDRDLIAAAKPALEKEEKVTIDREINNTNRTVGTMLSGLIAKEYGEEGLADDTININLTGYAGQSFGAFAMKGLTLKLEGQANDYVAKGMFGGKVIVKQPDELEVPAHKNVIAGNTILYGATEGELYMNGVAGERFGVRNSGAHAVVEGIGDHGCEYMTGGRVVVLGQTGRNFGAGMSGGIAYVYDIDGNFTEKVNDLMVDIEELKEEDLELVQDLVTNHVEYTGSERGREVLENWDEVQDKFVKIIPPKYKEIMAERREDEE